MYVSIDVNFYMYIYWKWFLEYSKIKWYSLNTDYFKAFLRQKCTVCWTFLHAATSWRILNSMPFHACRISCSHALLCLLIILFLTGILSSITSSTSSKFHKIHTLQVVIYRREQNTEKNKSINKALSYCCCYVFKYLLRDKFPISFRI